MRPRPIFTPDAAASIVPRVLFTLGTAVVLLPHVLFAETTSEVVPWYQTIQVNGLVSGGYSYNFNRPDSRTNHLRVFDFDDNSAKVDVFELVVQKPAIQPGETGFRADVTTGASIPRVSASAGLFRDRDTGEAEDIDLQQAYVTYVAPAGRGLRIDAGKFVTAMGYEVIEGYDGYNDNATRSLLFGYAIPFTHTGLRLSYAFTSALSAQLHIVNGWDNVADNNTGKSVGLQIAYAPISTLSLLFNAMSGPEQAENNDARRDMADVVAIWKPRSTLTLGLNADSGGEDEAAPDGGRAEWRGAAGYVRVGLAPRFAATLRAEVFDDPDGVRTGAAQTVREATLTPEWRVSDNLVFRADLRADQSTRDTFEKRDDATDSQTTVLLNALYMF
jgi:hypothetical protein